MIGCGVHISRPTARSSVLAGKQSNGWALSGAWGILIDRFPGGDLLYVRYQNTILEVDNVWRLDRNGNKRWSGQKQIYFEFQAAAGKEEDEGCYLPVRENLGGGSYDYYLRRLDENGEVDWDKDYDAGAIIWRPQAVSCGSSAQEGYSFVGFRIDNGAFLYVVIGKIRNSDGALQWSTVSPNVGGAAQPCQCNGIYYDEASDRVWSAPSEPSLSDYLEEYNASTGAYITAYSERRLPFGSSATHVFTKTPTGTGQIQARNKSTGVEDWTYANTGASGTFEDGHIYCSVYDAGNPEQLALAKLDGSDGSEVEKWHWRNLVPQVSGAGALNSIVINAQRGAMYLGGAFTVLAE